MDSVNLGISYFYSLIGDREALFSSHENNLVMVQKVAVSDQGWASR